MKRFVSILFALVLALGVSLMMAAPVYAVHALTPGASVDIDADTNGGAYTALNNISFTDTPELVATNTFYLTAPAGFEFNPTAAADQAVGTGYAGGVIIDLGGGAGVAQPPVYSVGNTVATWTVTAAGTVGVGTITISGMELRPTAAKTTIVGDGTANVTIAGNVTTFDSPNAHPIDHVPGALNNFLVEAQGGGNIGTQTAGTAFLIQITARDQYNNTLNDGTNFFDGALNTVDITSNVTISAGGGTTAAFTAGVLNNHSMTLTQTSAAATITATDSGGGLGTGAETGTSNAFVVDPAGIDHYTVAAVASPLRALEDAVFGVIQAQDVYNNNITAGADAAENINITFGLADAGATPISTVTANGTATVYIVMTVVQNGQSVTFTGAVSGKTGTSNAFNVIAPTFGGGGPTGSLAPPAPPAPPPSPPPAVQANLFGSSQSFSISDTGKVLEAITGTSDDGNLTLTIPVDTIALDMNGDPLSSLTARVDLSPPSPPSYIIGRAYDFGPDGATFNPAMTLTWSYDPAVLPEGISEEDLVVEYYDESAGEWVACPSTVDTATHTITASASHFTTFAIIAHTVTAPEGAPLNTWAIIGIIVAAIVVILVIVMLVRRRA